MKNFLRYLALVTLLLTGCASVPPQVVTSAETLKSYSNKLGDAQLQVINRYQQRLSSVNAALADTAQRYVQEYEKDVNTLARQVNELREAYDRLAEALTRLLDADTNATRNSIVNAADAERLRQLLQAQREKRAERIKATETIINPGAFNDARRMLQQTQSRIQNQSAEVHKMVTERLKEEYTHLNDGFDTLIIYLRSLVKVREEQKRVLGLLEKRAESLAEDVTESKTLSQLGDILKGFTEAQ